MQNHSLEELTGLAAILEPFRTVFDELCRRIPRQMVSHVLADEAPLASLHLTIPTYTIFHDSTRTEIVEADASIPQGTPLGLRNAILKANMCDFALLVFLPHLTHILQGIGAQVDWMMILEMRPLFRLRHHGERLREQQVLHSVFLITTPTRKQIIADFTIEQFGYDACCWLTVKSDYLAGFSADGRCYIATEDQIDLVRWSANQCAFMPVFQRTANHVCSAFDWRAYRLIYLPDRLPWVRALVRNAHRNIGATISAQGYHDDWLQLLDLENLID